MAIDIGAVTAMMSEGLKSIRHVKDVADALNVSAETLRKEIVRRTRKSFSDHLTELRIDKMKRMLVETDQRCFEICFDVGFQREDTGAKFFKRMTGVTMEQFRESVRREELRIRSDIVNVSFTLTANANLQRQPEK